jgi:hypothetical protein
MDWDYLLSKGMKKIEVIVISLVNFIAISCAHAEGMCREGETIIFDCELQKSISSLCESKDAGVLSYRNGVTNKINLEISDGDAGKVKVFYFSSTPYAGGGEAHIRFSKAGYTLGIPTICTIRLSRQMTVQHSLVVSLYIRAHEKSPTLYVETMPQYIRMRTVILLKSVIEA